MSCDLGMRDIRDSRHTLLIEKCRQLDPRKLADPDKMRFVGKMFVKVPRCACCAFTSRENATESAQICCHVDVLDCALFPQTRLALAALCAHSHLC